METAGIPGYSASLIRESSYPIIPQQRDLSFSTSFQIFFWPFYGFEIFLRPLCVLNSSTILSLFSVPFILCLILNSFHPLCVLSSTFVVFIFSILLPASSCLKSSSNRFIIQIFFHLLYVFFNSSSHLPMFRNLFTSTILLYGFQIFFHLLNTFHLFLPIS